MTEIRFPHVIVAGVDQIVAVTVGGEAGARLAQRVVRDRVVGGVDAVIGVEVARQMGDDCQYGGVEDTLPRTCRMLHQTAARTCASTALAGATVTSSWSFQTSGAVFASAITATDSPRPPESWRRELAVKLEFICTVAMDPASDSAARTSANVAVRADGVAARDRDALERSRFAPDEALPCETQRVVALDGADVAHRDVVTGVAPRLPGIE